MNKRQRKKNVGNIINNICVLKLEQNDVLLLKVDILKYNFADVEKFVIHMRKTTGQNNIFVIPADIDLCRIKNIVSPHRDSEEVTNAN